MTVEEAEHAIREVIPQILDELPDEVRSITQNLCVRVENEAPPEVLRKEDCRALAYYHGFSLRDRSVFQPAGWPDEVVLLAGPISRFATASGRDVREIIRICLVHELAHLVGLTHARMRELGYTFDAPTKERKQRR